MTNKSNDDPKRVESYLYHRLGLEENDDMVSDNAFDRVNGAWRAYEEGDIKVPGDWETPKSWGSSTPAKMASPSKSFAELNRMTQVLVVVSLFVLAGVVAGVTYWLLTRL